eukprot:3678989-Amphidinium_carterae.1
MMMGRCAASLEAPALCMLCEHQINIELRIFAEAHSSNVITGALIALAAAAGVKILHTLKSFSVYR